MFVVLAFFNVESIVVAAFFKKENSMLGGSTVALVTPFKQGNVDEAALQALVDWQCCSGTQGILVCGTTGEGALLSQEERNRITTLSVEAAQGRAAIVVGIPTNNTSDAIHMVTHAKKNGAKAALVVTPFYLKPSQQGIYEHFKAIHDATDLPLVSYNNPGRSVVEQSVDLVLRLAELPRLVALKDSTNDVSRPALIKPKLPKNITLLCGDDPLTAAYLANGGDGFMSVTANVAPALMAQFYKAWVAQDREAFETLNARLMPLHLALFCETNPCPVKYGVSVLRGIENSFRLPLLPPTTASQEKVRTALSDAMVL